MVKCPTCDRIGFHSEATMRQHHTKVHGKKLPNNTCQLCEKEFYSRDNKKVFCKECYSSFKGKWGPKHSSKKETAECSVLSCTNSFKYYPSEKEGIICPSCVEEGKTAFDTEKAEEIKQNMQQPNNKPTFITKDCSICSNDVTFRKGERGDRVVCSEECQNELRSKEMKGESNPRYKDGKSRGRNYNTKWRKIREEVLERDGRECIICSSTELLQGHHIIPVDEFLKEDEAHYIENAVTVCPSCHRNIEYENVAIPQNLIEENNLEVYEGEYF